MTRIIILFSILLLGVLVIPASAQSATNHVVINEIDTNPPSDDAKSINEWIELYNPTDSKIDIGEWKIVSTNALKKTMTIPIGTVIEPGKFLTYSYQSLWFADSSELVELHDKNGILVDKTPLMTDLKNDFASWQRIYDGYDLDSSDDWKFATSTAGSSNGKVVSAEEKEIISVSVSTNKSSYLFSETADIRGHISKVFITAPYFHAEEILVKITGPKYDKTITLYPDLDLNYKTSLNLSQVLGINQGVYSVLVSYAGATSQTSFSVGEKIIVSDIKEDSMLSLITDKSQYLPGDTISVTGLTTQVIPFEGLKFTIKDPNGKSISTGNLYPTNGKFITSVFLTTVNPVYGKYEIIGEYYDKSAHAFFDVVKDIKEEKTISLWTDKESYGLGQTVTITGRLNNVWVGSLDLEIIQTRNAALGSSSLGGGNSGFKILDIVRTAGDGSFTYTFKIPESDVRLGDYKISVSKEVGSASKVIHAVTNPDQYVSSDDDPLSLSTDKVIYDLGDTMTINGFIANPASRSSFETSTVKISLSHEDDSPLNIVALPSGAKTRERDGLIIAYEFTAIPESSGRFSVQTSITQTVFTEGTYVIKAEYQGLAKTTIVGIVDPLKLSNGMLLTLNKQVYGLGETVSLTGLIPPTGDTSIVISIAKPDGSTISSGAVVDNQKFSWSWVTPITEKPIAIKSEDRSLSKSNFGIYKIHVSTASFGEDIFFKVSSDPENDSLSLTPLYVSTEKSLYKAGEKLKVIGNVITREHGSEGLVVPERVTITVLDGKFPFKQIHQAYVYPDQGGNFQSLFELPITIFSEGEYKVKAQYSTKQSESTFSIANDFAFGSDANLSLLLSTDKSEYYPGDVVTVSGKPNKLIYIEKFDISVIKKTGSEITCGSFYCGTHSGPVTTIRPSPSGSFSYLISLPNSSSSLGSYEVTADAGFETKSLIFDVVQKPAMPESEIPSVIIEKVNRISDDKISIITNQKTVENKQFAPRVISGVLFTPQKDDSSSVNLRVTSESGMCIIGPEEDCLVKDSTRKPGQIYDVIEIDGHILNVRYSGPDTRLEKFDILPESPTEFLPDANWHVDIIKDDQVSRFYYKINYNILE